MSALFGWYVTAGLHAAGKSRHEITISMLLKKAFDYLTISLFTSGYPWLVVIWYIITEAVLLWYMRDCGIILCLQLACPVEVRLSIDKST